MDYLASINGKIGGPGGVVEIDESMFYKRKYNRGRQLGSGWIFGGVERDNHAKAFMIMVERRNADTLIPLILSNIEKGSIIISDQWKAYDSLSSLGYIHYSINHSENFVSPINQNIHTQNIENFWRWAKRRFKSTTKKSKRLTRLGEHLFRKKFPENTFEEILNQIKLSYSIE